MGLWTDCRALLRSWRIYHSNPQQDRVMDALYASFIKPGDLVFDIGAHIGHRTASFRRLGARVVALEPQPLAAKFVRLLYGLRGDVQVLRAACGASGGTARLKVNSENPIVSTLSPAFVAAADGAKGWEGQTWDRTIEAPMVSLDDLIARYGRPSFVKIDVEGFERDVLAGLSWKPPALSYEFTTIQRAEALACLHRCVELGYRRFNVSVGETHALEFPQAIPAAEMEAWLESVPESANSGDVYAVG
ncbi:MAG: methyltransferase FkbM [Hyphomicrobiales bacterium]|nr:methyltransferase FkbM [Hyphomicrobiales bacterium]